MIDHPNGYHLLWVVYKGYSRASAAVENVFEDGSIEGMDWLPCM